MAIVRFTLAVDRRFKKGEADFIHCVAFGKTAEVIERYCGQGTKIAIRGHIQTGSYKNQDGATVYTTDVVIDEMDFAESKASAQRGTQSNSNQSLPDSSPTDADGFMSIPDGVSDDELPFI